MELSVRHRPVGDFTEDVETRRGKFGGTATPSEVRYWLAQAQVGSATAQGP